MNAPPPQAARVTIRLAAPADAGTVLAMVGEMARHQDQTEHVTSSVDRWSELLSLSEVTVLIAEVDGYPVGYVSAVQQLHLWSGSELLALDDLYVRATHRNHGVGLSLMTELSQRADGKTITWGVQPDNHGAIRFYTALGASVRAKVVCGWSADQQRDAT